MTIKAILPRFTGILNHVYKSSTRYPGWTIYTVVQFNQYTRSVYVQVLHELTSLLKLDVNSSHTGMDNASNGTIDAKPKTAKCFVVIPSTHGDRKLRFMVSTFLHYPIVESWCKYITGNIFKVIVSSSSSRWTRLSQSKGRIFHNHHA